MNLELPKNISANSKTQRRILAANQNCHKKCYETDRKISPLDEYCEHNKNISVSIGHNTRLTLGFVELFNSSITAQFERLYGKYMI